jgi:hypothetical protein
MQLHAAVSWIMSVRESHNYGGAIYDDDSIVATMVGGEVTGVVEVATILSSL